MNGRLVAYLLVVAMAALLVWRGETTRDDAEHRNAQARVDVCRYIDAAQNRERFRLIEGERQILGPFRDLFPGLNDRQLRRIHRTNRRRYNQVADTRPMFCPPLKRIAPYPSLEALKSPPAKGGGATRTQSPPQRTGRRSQRAAA
jgi:hypothetical protein